MRPWSANGHPARRTGENARWARSPSSPHRVRGRAAPRESSRAGAGGRERGSRELQQHPAALRIVREPHARAVEPQRHGRTCAPRGPPTGTGRASKSGVADGARLASLGGTCSFVWYLLVCSSELVYTAAATSLANPHPDPQLRPTVIHSCGQHGDQVRIRRTAAGSRGSNTTVPQMQVSSRSTSG